MPGNSLDRCRTAGNNSRGATRARLQPTQERTLPAECLSRRQFLLSLAALPLAIPAAELAAAPLDLPNPGAKDTCPVCGMFVAKYPHWIATVRYRDGHAHHFDGAKDLFKYLHDLARWAPGQRHEDIEAIGVTEYYGLQRIAAKDAWYVIGSDVLGPMGHELVPLATAADAEEFQKDHQGRRILRFDAVTPALVQALDEGRFDVE
ncbi:MAG: nitrous oxide reductase accessory protein NosL [Thiotrichales bacterium]